MTFFLGIEDKHAYIRKGEFPKYIPRFEHYQDMYDKYENLGNNYMYQSPKFVRLPAPRPGRSKLQHRESYTQIIFFPPRCASTRVRRQMLQLRDWSTPSRIATFNTLIPVRLLSECVHGSLIFFLGVLVMLGGKVL